jgi:hypothetical protein
MVQKGSDRNLGEPCQFRKDGSDKLKKRGGIVLAWWSDQPIVEA